MLLLLNEAVPQPEGPGYWLFLLFILFCLEGTIPPGHRSFNVNCYVNTLIASISKGI